MSDSAWSEGVMDGGAVVLLSGQPVPVELVVAALQGYHMRITELQRVTSCLLDHYLNTYGINDGDPTYAGKRDRLSEEAENLIPNWRDLRNEWNR